MLHHGPIPVALAEGVGLLESPRLLGQLLIGMKGDDPTWPARAGDTMKPTDATLVKRTLAADVEAHGELVDRYRNAAYGLACHLVGGLEETEDATQEALVRALYRLAHLRVPAKFGPWLRRIVASVCANWRTRESRRPRPQRAGDDVGAACSDPHQALVAKELARSLEEMIGRLTEPNRLAVIICCIDGLSHQEIGGFLGVNADAVKMRVRRAR